MNKPAPEFFNKDGSASYDERNSRLSAITENMHFLIRLALRDLPENSRILCVGVGTGAEIFSLAKAYPTWTFVGVDPSASMLDVCRERLQKAGIAGRCELINGYVTDVPPGAAFDASLSILVGHFVRHDERQSFYQDMATRIRKGGYLINTEISFDLDSKQFPTMLRGWEAVHELMGATPEKLKELPSVLREMLTIRPPEEITKLIESAGIENPVRFFQSFMICGWMGVKS